MEVNLRNLNLVSQESRWRGWSVKGSGMKRETERIRQQRYLYSRNEKAIDTIDTESTKVSVVNDDELIIRAFRSANLPVSLQFTSHTQVDTCQIYYSPNW